VHAQTHPVHPQTSFVRLDPRFARSITSSLHALPDTAGTERRAHRRRATSFRDRSVGSRSVFRAYEAISPLLSSLATSAGGPWRDALPHDARTDRDMPLRDVRLRGKC
jgi:hypothetical protein